MEQENQKAEIMNKGLGALMGTAVGDALGMPVEGLSHQNVRLYYKGIKTYRADEKRQDLGAGQWTDDTQFTFALARALTGTAVLPGVAERLAEQYTALRPEARRWGSNSTTAVDRLLRGVTWENSGGSEPSNGAAMRAAPLGIWWAATGAPEEEAFHLITQLLGITHRHPVALVAGLGQAFAIKYALLSRPGTFDRDRFWAELLEAVRRAEQRLSEQRAENSSRLQNLATRNWMFPLDLQDVCEGTGIRADQSWPFAIAMFARSPDLIEATLLSTVNAGGDADTTGAMVGALVGALHGWEAFPDHWREELEDAGRLEQEACAFILQNSPTNAISGSSR